MLIVARANTSPAALETERPRLERLLREMNLVERATVLSRLDAAGAPIREAMGHPTRGGATGRAVGARRYRGNRSAARADESVGPGGRPVSFQLSQQRIGGRHWTRTSDLLHVKQVL